MESRVLAFHTFDLPKVRHSLFKRLFDIFFSLAALSISSPLLLLMIGAVWISSKGPIFYTQPRIGRGGKVFKCYKLRTMYLDADARLQGILNGDPRLQQEWNKSQKLKQDPRVFPFGKWLRRTSLDEFPQFWNVLKGELSVVGPRPYMVSQQQALGPYAYKILSVRPGITGLWQTCGRSRTSFKGRLLLDTEYVNKRSFLFDLFLIIKTIPEVFFTKNAY